MNKSLELKKNVVVGAYNNDFKVESDLFVQTNIINSKDIVFNEMLNTLVIEITQSGSYKIIANNKNITINIASKIKVDIIEVNNCAESTYISNVRLNVGEDTSVTYLIVDTNFQAYNNRDVSVEKNGHLDLHIVGFNKGYNENKILIDLNGSSASANLKIITLANNDTHSIYDARINNNAPKTKADIWQKAVIKNGGSNDFLATGFIKKGADNASNYQESRVLLLDKAAIGNASPILLIDHYNVIAGHAAGVSRVNEDDLYYLQSRGIDKVSAEHLITMAFVRPLVDLIKDEDLKTFVENQIENIIFG